MKTCNRANLRVKYKHITRKRGKNMEEKKTKMVGVYLTEKVKDELVNRASGDHLTVSEVGEILFSNYLSGRLSIQRSAHQTPSVCLNENIETLSSSSPIQAENAEPLPRTAIKRKKTASFTIRIDPEQRDALNARAKEEGFTTSKIIDILFENYLNGNIKIKSEESKDSETL